MRLPPAALLDTSVLLRLFHDHRDAHQRAADMIRDRWTRGRIELVLLDLSVYEFVNVLVRRLGKDEERAAADADALFDLGLPTASVDRDLARAAARLAAATRLSGYDAAFVAAARGLGIPLITADARITREAQDGDVLSLAALAEEL